jgi:thymidylate synthase ThyX
VRQSDGLAIQESQRYVQYGERKPFEVVVPVNVKEQGFAQNISADQQAHLLYEEMVSPEVPKEDARYILPGGISSRLL